VVKQPENVALKIKPGATMTEDSQGSQSKIVVLISSLFLAAAALGLAFIAYHGPNPDSVFVFFRSSLVTPVAAVCAVCMAALSGVGFKRLMSM